MMQTFKTLLLREWMQHQRGWWLLTLVPLLLTLLALSFGNVQLDGEELPAGMYLIIVLIYTLVVVGLAGLAVAIQAPGLARRDQQDRSIEFWLSLPVGHVPAIGATVLSHLVLFPLMALALGFAGSLLVAPLFVVRGFGWSALWSLPWAGLMPVLGVGLLREIIGLLLALVWVAPLVLCVMAASAWLKRWGVPVVVAVVGLGGVILEQAYGISLVHDTVSHLWNESAQALIPGLREAHVLNADGLARGELAGLPAWLMADLGQTLAALASPQFVFALLFSLACGALLVWRRQRA